MQNNTQLTSDIADRFYSMSGEDAVKFLEDFDRFVERMVILQKQFRPLAIRLTAERKKAPR